MIVGGGVLTAVGALSPNAMFIVLGDGLIAVGVVAASTGLGLWIVRGLGLHAVELRWRWMLSAALGLGTVSLLVLGLGVFGILHRSVWIAILVLSLAAGLAGLPFLKPGLSKLDIDRAGTRLSWLWLLAIGFCSLALLGGTTPPGLLWADEGRGYDVLEYHLGVPREYFDAGKISYLPHNIYSNFPFNVEMLYLLSMVLHGDPIDAVYTAKLLNVFLAILAAAAVWLAGREFGADNGIIAGLMAATCPFLVYLSGVAYVENGLMLYAAMSLAAILRSFGDASRTRRWAFASGLLAGLACGCKYTAVPGVALPIMILVFLQAIRRRPRRLEIALPFCVGCVVTFTPWLVKNAVTTGNPVFPLAYDVFGAHEGVWDADCAARWHEGHLPAPEDRPIPRRILRFWHQVVASERFGPIVGLGFIAGLFSAGIMALRKRADNQSNFPGEQSAQIGVTACWLMIFAGIAWWLGFSHLVDRFAIVLLVPCTVLIGQAWTLLRSPVLKKLTLVLLISVAGFNFLTTWRWFSAPNALGPDLKVSYLDLNVFGRTDVLTESPHTKRLNEILNARKKVLLVGEARRFYLSEGVDYCVVFNRNPFAEAAGKRSSVELLAWLQDQGYAYVYVDWSEMRRLRNSRYGFWRPLTRELFDELTRVGLQRVEDFSFAQGGPSYATLFAVP